jgi:hypothetical protein
MADERDWDLERGPDPATPGPGTTRLIGDLAPLMDIETDAPPAEASVGLDELRPDELELLHELQQPSSSTLNADLLIDLTGELDAPALDPPAREPRSLTAWDVDAAGPPEALKVGTPSSEPDPLNPVFQEPRPLR